LVHKRHIAVVVDSSSCLPRAALGEYDIYVVPHELVIGETVLKDGIDIEPGEFYQMLQKNQNVPTTSSPKPDSFLEAFRSASKVAEELVCITLSANFSATYDSARVAARIAESELPDCRVKVVDSMAAAGAQGLIALEAARMAMRGAGLDQVIARIRQLVPSVSLVAFLNTLYYLSKSGRVPRVAAWAGFLLGIKPLAELKLGEARMIEKPRSRAKATQRLMDVMKDRVRDKPVHVNVMHAHAAEDAEGLRQQVEKGFDCRELLVSEFTPVMGTHLGPGLLGLAFYTDVDEGRPLA
jgi:DegV family protein with EDD domain